MNEKLDIKNTLEVLDFGYELYTAGKDLKSGGVATIPNHLMPLYLKAQPALQDINMVPKELADLDESEAGQIVTFLVSKGVANEHVAAIAAKSFKVAIAGYELFKEISE